MHSSLLLSALFAGLTLADFTVYTVQDVDVDCGVAKTGGCHPIFEGSSMAAGPPDLHGTEDDCKNRVGGMTGAEPDPKGYNTIKFTKGLCGTTEPYTCTKGGDGRYSCKGDDGSDAVTCDNAPNEIHGFNCHGTLMDSTTYTSRFTCKSNISC